MLWITVQKHTYKLTYFVNHIHLRTQIDIHMHTCTHTGTTWNIHVNTCMQMYAHVPPHIHTVGKVFAKCPGDKGSIPGRIILNTLKMVLDTSLLNTQQYKVRINRIVEQSRERSSALP